MARREPSVGAPLALVGALVVTIALVLAAPAWATDLATSLYPLGAAALLALACACMAWWAHPAYTISAGIFLTPLAGNWPQLGIPGPLSPDRWLLLAGIGAVLLRAPSVRDRPRLRLTAVHALLAVAVLYTVVSASVAGTIFDNDPFAKIVDAFGIIPFLLFLVAPVAFQTEWQRRVLLISLMALGLWLGFTVLVETLKVDALVWPRYILDPNYGIHVGRGRGPFVDAVANGLALYTCAVACGLAYATWHGHRERIVAASIGVLSLVGSFLSLQRSVWIAAALASATVMLATRGLRRFFLPVAVATGLAVLLSLAVIPGLSGRVASRANDKGPVWDRQNLNRAAINMVEARPLLGFGWSKFIDESNNYFQQSDTYPLTDVGKAGIHNVPLLYAVELGLIGAILWLLCIGAGVGSALASRAPPELEAWRVGLLAVAIAFVVVSSFVPPSAWPNRSLWLFAGVLYAGRYAIAPSSGESKRA